MPQPSTAYRAENSFGLLLLGEPLRGKTNTSMLFPDPYFLDADDKLNNAIQRFKSKRFWFDKLNVDENGKQIDAKDRWNRAVACLKAAALVPEIKTIVVSSLTPLVDALQYHIMNVDKDSSKLMVAGEKVMQQTYWTPFRELLQRLILGLRTTGKYVVVECHEEPIKDEITGEVRYTPMIPGQLRNKLASVFSDVWRCETREKFGTGGSSTEYYVRTQPKSNYPLACSIGLEREQVLTEEILLAKLPK